jgi:hypothetical protein
MPAVVLYLNAAMLPCSKMSVRSGRKLESKESNFNVSDERSGMHVPAPERGGGGGDEAMS